MGGPISKSVRVRVSAIGAAGWFRKGTKRSAVMSKMLKLLNAVRKDEEGAALVEYALLIGLIAVVCIVVVTALGSAVSSKLSTACSSLGGTGC